MTNSQDIFWMQHALQFARKSEENGEVPVGAVLILNDTVIGEGQNSPISHLDPTAHAEILAIRAAAKHMQNYRLPETTLYITLEPCIMCLGAIIQARIQRVVYGATDLKYGAIHSLSQTMRFNHYPVFTSGILKEPCSKILSEFFRRKRKNG